MTFLNVAIQIIKTMQVDVLLFQHSITHSRSAPSLNSAKNLEAEEYDFEFRETRTGEIIEDTKNFRSELGILYLSNYNTNVLTKTFTSAGLEFVPLFQANPHVFVGENHPLAQKDFIVPDDLEDYPRYSFEQGIENSFFFSEEPLSHLNHKQTIAISDRGTLSNLLTHHNGYTISTGVLSEEMNTGIVAIPLQSDEKMTVGYIHHEQNPLSMLAVRYLELLRSYIVANPTVANYYENTDHAHQAQRESSHL